MVAAPIAESVVKTILATDKMIEYCALVDADGKIEAGGIRRGFGEEDVASVPPGHDAWVVGDEPTVGIELIGARIATTRRRRTAKTATGTK